MGRRRVTVTVDEQRLEAVRQLVADGQAVSVSAFVDHALELALEDVAGWAGDLRSALAATGGPLSNEEGAWAERALRGGS